MFCTKCGKKMFEGQKFCDACGTEVLMPEDNSVFKYISITEDEAKRGCVKDVFAEGCAMPSRISLLSPEGKPFVIKSTILMTEDGSTVERPLTLKVGIIREVPKKRSIWRWLWIPIAVVGTIILMSDFIFGNTLWDSLEVEEGIVMEEPDPYAEEKPHHDAPAREDAPQDIPAKEEPAPDAVYDPTGKWVSGESLGDVYEYEMVIHSYDDNSITFSLEFYRLWGCEDITAVIVDDVAYFNTGDDFIPVGGEIYFYGDTITLIFTDSEFTYIEPGMKLVFHR